MAKFSTRPGFASSVYFSCLTPLLTPDFFAKRGPGVLLPHRLTPCLCRWKEGYCHFGDRCNFAHGEHELRYVPPEVVSQFEQHKRIQDQAGLGPGGAMLPVGPGPRPPPPAGPMPPPRPQQSITPPRQQGSSSSFSGPVRSPAHF